MSHFRPVAHIETFDFLASLHGRMKEFDRITLRQDAPGSPHKDTRAIFLRGPEYGTGYTSEELISVWFQDVRHVDYPILADWPEAQELMESVASTLRVGPFGKVMLVELKPRGALVWHIDQGSYAEAYDRYHLPLISNPKAWMYSGGEHAHLPVGVLTGFDNRVLHSAVNFGATPRIHLIVDVRKEGITYG